MRNRVTNQFSAYSSAHASAVRQPSSLLLAVSAVHVCNDAFFALLYPLLPFVAADLGLNYAQIGLLKSVFSLSSSSLQWTVGLLAERWGEYLTLILGNAWVAGGLLLATLAGSFSMLLLLLGLAGAGGNAQHPLGTSLVARATPVERRSQAIGTLNFTGDLGKMIGSAFTGLFVVTLGWRLTMGLIAAIGLIFSLLMLRVRMVEVLPAPAGSDRREQTPSGTASGFLLLIVVGMLDAMARGGGLTFLPFLVAGKGQDPAAISLLFTLIFAAGAVGKFSCGWLGDRFGTMAVIWTTEAATALAMLLFVPAPVVALIPLSLLFGFALNGTSSVLYSAVTYFVPSERYSRAYGAYYTATLCASGLAPVGYGLLADRMGLAPVFAIMAAITALILPLSLGLRRLFVRD